MIHKPKLGELAKRLECVRLAGALALRWWVRKREQARRTPDASRVRFRLGPFCRAVFVSVAFSTGALLLQAQTAPEVDGGGKAGNPLPAGARPNADDGAHGVTRPTSRSLEMDRLDQELFARLQQLGFTGNIENTLEQRLGRPVDPARANLGRLLWFDTITGLNNDNSCAGCHLAHARIRRHAIHCHRHL